MRLTTALGAAGKNAKEAVPEVTNCFESHGEMRKSASENPTRSTDLTPTKLTNTLLRQFRASSSTRGDAPEQNKYFATEGFWRLLSASLSRSSELINDCRRAK
jgi:hypothetical protein